MPINFNLEEIRQKYNCSIYFETGLWDPRDNISSKQALEANFNKIFCIEIRKDWVELGNNIFRNDIITGRYNLFLDDSTNMTKYINYELFNNNRAIFFLDAHVDNENIHNFKKRCPLFDELEAIKSIGRNDHIIMIDDLRILENSFPWGENSYGNINFIEKIKEHILSINENYKFSTLNGHIDNDVLVAYV